MPRRRAAVKEWPTSALDKPWRRGAAPPVAGIDHPGRGDGGARAPFGKRAIGLDFENLGRGERIGKSCGPWVRLTVPLEKPQWKELFSEVVTSGLCTGVRGLRHRLSLRVLDYETDGVYRPFHLDIDGGPEDCTHGTKGLHDVHEGLSAIS